MRVWFLSLAVSGVTFAADTPVTFHKDVEPILVKSCQSCFAASN